MQKHLAILLVCSVFVGSAFTQNVGIGTTKPHSSAALEIKSDNKG